MSESSATVPRLQARGLGKRYGNTQALDDVSFELGAGDCLAILGENGAGKSTLMGVLAGTIVGDAGQVLVDGREVRARHPADSRAAGITLVHQELAPFPDLDVAENVALGTAYVRQSGALRSMSGRLRKALSVPALARLPHPMVSAERKTSDLPVGALQIVELCRALAGETRVLLLDEPTSSLSRDDAERLFALIAELRADGVAIIYISHFLDEVRRVADQFLVLRDGRRICTGRLSQTTDDEVLAAMVGRAVEQVYPPRHRTAGAVAVRVRDLAAPPRLRSASFDLRRGEILGIAGLVGSGRTELCRALVGLDDRASGTVAVGDDPPGQAVAPSVRARIHAGFGYLSEDRKGEGLALGMPILDNIALSSLNRGSRFGLVPRREQRKDARALIDRLGIRCAEADQPVGQLSGGNQQKVALARLLRQGADVLVLDEPTRGVDVVSKTQLYAAIDAEARAGRAVLVTSSSLPELFGLCDRVAVMCRGVLGEPRAVDAWTADAVLAVATGARDDRHPAQGGPPACA